jgi:hypothetical protein
MLSLRCRLSATMWRHQNLHDGFHSMRDARCKAGSDGGRLRWNHHETDYDVRRSGRGAGERPGHRAHRRPTATETKAGMRQRFSRKSSMLRLQRLRILSGGTQSPIAQGGRALFALFRGTVLSVPASCSQNSSVEMALRFIRLRLGQVIHVR